MNISELAILQRVLFRAMSRALKRFGDGNVSIVELSIVTRIYGSAGVSISEIVESIGFAQSYVSTMVRSMEKRGIVELHTDPDDKRRTLVSLQPAYREQLDALKQEDVSPVLEGLFEPDTNGSVNYVAEMLDALYGAVNLDHMRESPDARVRFG